MSRPFDNFSGGCFRYPLLDLQKQDTDLGLSFYVDLHVFNKAGHAVTIKTENFTIPAMYPPAEAIVIDLLPDLDEDVDISDISKGDIDAHLSTQTLCAMWNEFTHHEDVKLEFGVGTLNRSDDVYAFTEIAATNRHCVNSTAIPDDVILFVSIRATTSGGSTISSSDGVIIYNTNRILEQLEILDGAQCIIPENLLGETTDSVDGVLVFSPQLADGQIYTLRFIRKGISRSDIDLQTLNAYILYVNSDLPDRIDVVFQPYSDMQNLNLKSIMKDNATIEVYNCEDDVSLKLDMTSLKAHWRGLSEHFIYKTAAVKLRCNGPLEKCMQFLTPYAFVDGEEVEITNLQLEESETYYIAIRPCLNAMCLGPKLSSGVTVDYERIYDQLRITESSVLLSDNECSQLYIAWEGLFPEARISFFKWTVETSVGSSAANSTILPWNVVQKETETNFKVSPSHILQRLLSENKLIPKNTDYFMYEPRRQKRKHCSGVSTCAST